MNIYKNIRYILLFIVLPVLAIILFFAPFIAIVPNTSATKGTLIVLSRRIRRYVKLNDEIPHDLSNLPILRGFGNDIEDAWGNEIEYDINGKDVVLTSFGRDGKAGGEGEDEDIIEKFNAFKNLDDPFCGIILPQSKTYDTMSYIAERIEMFVADKNHLPETILNLPEMTTSKSAQAWESPESFNKIIDSWGKNIIYNKISPIKFKLFSYGEDLKKGGIGQYEDIERVFELNTKKGCVEISFNLRDE